MCLKKLGKVIGIAFVGIIFLSVPTHAEKITIKDEITMKDGGKIRGKILEAVPGKSYKVETAWGNIFICSMAEVEKVEYAKKIKLETIIGEPAIADEITMKDGSKRRGNIIETAPDKFYKIETFWGNIFVCQMDKVEKVAYGKEKELAVIREEPARADEITMKDGSKRRGKIIETVPGESYKIEIAWGNIFVCRIDEVEKVGYSEEKETVDETKKIAKEPKSLSEKPRVSLYYTIYTADDAYKKDVDMAKKSLNDLLKYGGWGWCQTTVKGAEEIGVTFEWTEDNSSFYGGKIFYTMGPEYKCNLYWEDAVGFIEGQASAKTSFMGAMWNGSVRTKMSKNTYFDIGGGIGLAKGEDKWSSDVTGLSGSKDWTGLIYEISLATGVAFTNVDSYLKLGYTIFPEREKDDWSEEFEYTPISCSLGVKFR